MPVVYASIVFHLRAAHMSFFRAQGEKRKEEKKRAEKTLFSYTFVTHTVYLRALEDQTNAHITIPLTSAERTRREECRVKTGWWWDSLNRQ